MTATTSSNSMVRRLLPADLDAAAEIHRRAFQGYPNVLLGSRYVKAMLSWFCATPERLALGAFDASEQLTGYVVGAPTDQVHLLARELRREMLIGFATHPWLVVHPRILATVWSRLRDRFLETPPYALPQIPTPCMDLFSIAVDARRAGTGIGGKLMTVFEAESRRLAMRSMYLAVFPTNAAARRMYEKTGWVALPVPPKPGDAMHYLRTLNDG